MCAIEAVRIGQLAHCVQASELHRPLACWTSTQSFPSMAMRWRLEFNLWVRRLTSVACIRWLTYPKDPQSPSNTTNELGILWPTLFKWQGLCSLGLLDFSMTGPVGAAEFLFSTFPALIHRQRLWTHSRVLTLDSGCGKWSSNSCEKKHSGASASYSMAAQPPTWK